MTARMGIDTDKAIEMLVAGRPLRTIASIFRVDEVTLRAALRGAGVEFRGAAARDPEPAPVPRRRRAAPSGLASGELRKARYDERYWVKDPSYWPPVGRPGGYWVHPDPPWGHGENSSYIDYGCRCPDCRAANSDYQWYIKRGLTPPRSDHGQA